MIKKEEKNFSLLVFSSGKVPFSLNLNKTFLKTLLIVIPTFFLTFIAALSIFSLKYKIELDGLKNNEPAVIQKVKNEKIAIENELTQLRKENESLTGKLSSGDIKSRREPLLELFFTPVGQKNLINRNLCTLENLETKFDKNKVRFSFNLKNNREGEKLSGYVHVLSYSKEQIKFYPILDTDSFDAIRFNQGESFTVSRFRPVIAEFNISANIQKVWYKIFIFNRTGDLLKIIKTQEYFRQ
ncbi:hypothetical protein N9N67_01940 [Bacteriovoracaceae bacterium]|nr:hypothetical protein [Bacteriovoracaceae bacterium]